MACLAGGFCQRYRWKRDLAVTGHPVAIFPSSFAPHLGGVEELTGRLALSLSERGESPIVVTMRWPKSLPSAEVVGGVPVRRFVFRTPEPHLRYLAGWLATSRLIQRQIANVLVENRCRLIHVQCVSGNGYYAARLARQLGLPLVVSLQGELTMDATGVYQRSSVLPKLLTSLMQEADAITACSQHTLDEAIRFTGVDPGARAHVVYNGVSLKEFDEVVPERRERPFALAIGRHVQQKGFDVLLEAFASSIDGIPSGFELVLAGDGSETPRLKELARSLGVSDRVDFVGRTDRPRTAALFRGCDFFVLPSRHEPMGIVNVEAMASGRPVLASRVGGVPEFVVDGRNGLLVEPGDSTALASAMVKLATDANLRESLGRQGQADAQRFDWTAVTDEYQSIYENVLGGGRQRRGAGG